MNKINVIGILSLLVLLASCGNGLLIPDEDETETATESGVTQSINETFDYESFIGLDENDALALANQNDIPARIIMRDGERLMVTQDFVPGRINFSVRSGSVINYSLEGEY